MSGRRTKLVVLFGGRSAEHDVSRVTASHVLRAVDPERYDVLPIGIDREGAWLAATEARRMLDIGPEALPAALDAEGDPVEPGAALAPTEAGQEVVVLPLLHGPFGEDGTVQGLLELADVAYVGTGVLGSAVSMDKAMAKEVLLAAGIPQPRHVAFHVDSEAAHPLRVRERIDHELGWPVFVKPANLGSSIGVSKVSEPELLDTALTVAASYDEWIIVEEAIVGREVELAVLGNTGSMRVTVPGEIVPGAEFYDYEDKYVTDGAKLLVPADLDPETVRVLQALALRAADTLRVEGMARVDFFVEESGRGPLVNEVNTIPGFTPISMYPKLWQASGLSYGELVDELIRLASERHARRSSRRRTDR
ncbi:MAG: D-alanine--D-alanine ligase family protein [Actinomycetota bacterium]|nr:D-alanine--D-alanine ligase family protein [Actinomycetota bacterium]